MQYYILVDENNQIISADELAEKKSIPSGAIIITKNQFDTLNSNFSKPHEYINGKIQESRVAKINDTIQTAITTAKNKCQQQIVEQFYSSVLGTKHLYKNKLEDQINLSDLTSSKVDMPIKCVDVSLKGDFEYKMHTPEQIKQLYDEMVQHKNASLIEFDRVKNKLTEMIGSSSTVRTIQSRINAVLATQKG